MHKAFKIIALLTIIGVACISSVSAARCPKATTGFAAANGRLRTSGNKIVNKDGKQVILRGMSLFWSQWYGQFWNAGVVKTLKEDWHATVVRAAMGVESGGFLTNPWPEKQKVYAVIDAAIANGIYVIVDWHDHNANLHEGQAKSFFNDVADIYGDCVNIIWETYNEPLDNIGWQWIKAYHEHVLPTIRAKSQNLALLGNRVWDQRLDEVAANPLDTSKFPNIAYTVHFYAGSHYQWNRDMVTVAINKGLPVFASECGISDASGNGNLDINNFKTWITFLEKNGISWAVWSIADKNESSAALKPGASTKGGWPRSGLTTSGQTAYDLIRSKQ